MKLSDIVSQVTKLEGKKKSVSIGSVREVFRCLREVCRDREAFCLVANYLRYKSRQSLTAAKPKSKRGKR